MKIVTLFFFFLFKQFLQVGKFVFFLLFFSFCFFNYFFFFTFNESHIAGLSTGWLFPVFIITGKTSADILYIFIYIFIFYLHGTVKIFKSFFFAVKCICGLIGCHLLTLGLECNSERSYAFKAEIFHLPLRCECSNQIRVKKWIIKFHEWPGTASTTWPIHSH